MTDLVAERFMLAVDAVTAAFTLVARHIGSPGTLELIDIDHRLRALSNGDRLLMHGALQSLTAIAESPRLFGFRLVATALTHSLPRICRPQVTSMDIRTATLDLRQLANQAESLSAPDVAHKLAEIIDAILEHHKAPALATARRRLH